MARIKKGVAAHRRHKKTLSLAKGYRMSRSKLFKVAHEAVLHAGEYAFAGRRLRKRSFRRLWIVRLNAAVRALGMKYSEFISLLKKENIGLDRKILSFLAQDEKFFARLVEQIKK